MIRLHAAARNLRIARLSVFLIVCVCLIAAQPALGGVQGDSASVVVPLKAGWNLLSLPVDVTGATRGMIFPPDASNLFVYDSGYAVADTLRIGRGFWVKFPSSGMIAVKGVARYAGVISLRAGWNLIGGPTIPAAVSTIRTTPPGIVASSYFGFLPDSGYKSADTLRPGSGYWVKASQGGTMTLDPTGIYCPPVVDYAGKAYSVVQIGERCWLRENLDVGTMVPAGVWHSDNDTIEKYCYDDDSANCALYGGLYQWSEAMQYGTRPGAQGICPPGWHIPTRVEYETLAVAANNDGNALKSIGQGMGDGTGTNASGWSALLAGLRHESGGFGGFSDLGNYAPFWSSTQYPSSDADVMALYGSQSAIFFGSYQVWGYGFSIRCLKDYGAPPEIPSSPSPADGESGLFSSVLLSWSSGDPGGGPVTFDVYFGTDNPPAARVDSNLTTPNLFHDGLISNTAYHWKVVANAHGNLTEGPVWSFSTGGPYGLPCPGTPAVAYGGKTYNTVQVGSQCWLKENLDIGLMVPGTDTSLNNGIIEKYCYGDDTANCTLYGGLYQWDEAMQYTTVAGTQGICPPGWHIPTSSEYGTMASWVAGDGDALKAVGQGAGTNSSGFSGLFSGYRDNNIFGPFYDLGNYGYFWQSTEYDGVEANGFYVAPVRDINLNYKSLKSYGFGVRCIKDEFTPPGGPCPGTPSIEYGGKTYPTVLIGDQCWLKKNLDIGSMIPGTDTASDDGTIEKYCYDNDSANCAAYGGLYQWNEAMQYDTTEGVRGICPAGWHMPTRTEFATLSATVGGDGNALKAVGQGTGAGVGTNASGFSVLLSGARGSGYFTSLGLSAHLWSSTQSDSSSANNLRMSGSNASISVYDIYTKNFGFNVRCVRD